ncbi:TetR/AcrR family transcriptional regulator [Nocardia sp. CDC159]|uniref:TetR/AcrR family transcriptional regulator n=1 Tax=Nocardia pulmonis TaxID=2951408 RepID=A0A9X2E9Z5_9NOCA|nr:MULTISPECIES: TetR/AcrR family transcriptional regulator [Nocardia]MCM6776436.1 TetR/AcrR family transcriptional regulator [Nocardia pulmonis]MCM6788860.1 TetR/AcrR family transcriptional regulator [Nocardia sp. CDC159]
MSTPPGLREAKKQETRQAISDHATRLFIERGFEATTIAEVAEAARVAKKTVTNYFPRKEDLAIDIHERFVAWPAETVAARPVGVSALSALRAEFHAAATRFDAVAGFSGPEFCRMIADSPTLTARLRELHDLREDALAEALPGDELTRRAAAAQLNAALRLLFRRVLELTAAGRSRKTVARTAIQEADRIFDLLEPALGDYAAT